MRDQGEPRGDPRGRRVGRRGSSFSDKEGRLALLERVWDSDA